MKRTHLLTCLAATLFGAALAAAPLAAAPSLPLEAPPAVSATADNTAAPVTPPGLDNPVAADPVVTPLPDVPTPLTSAQMNELLAYLLTFVGAALVRPVTALLQSWRVTAAVDAKVISGLLSLLFVTGLGWKQGVYGQGATGVLTALAAGAAAFLYSYGKNRAASLAAEGGTRRAFLGKRTNAIGDTSTLNGLMPRGEEFPVFVGDIGEAGGVRRIPGLDEQRG